MYFIKWMLCDCALILRLTKMNEWIFLALAVSQNYMTASHVFPHLTPGTGR